MAFCAWFRAHGQLPPSLRRLIVTADVSDPIEIGPLVRELLQMRVQALTLYQDDDDESERAEELVSESLRSDAAHASLTELSLTRFGFPSALRGLRSRKLSVNMGFCSSSMVHELSTLPSWIGEMPLVELAVTSATNLRTLPTSLRSLSSLRFLDLNFTSLPRPFDADADNFDSIDRHECLERDSHAIDVVLVPLLDACPQLVVRILQSFFSHDAIRTERSKVCQGSWLALRRSRTAEGRRDGRAALRAGARDEHDLWRIRSSSLI